MITSSNTRKRTRKPGQPGGKTPTSRGAGSQDRRTCAVGRRNRGPPGAATPGPRPRPALGVGPFIPHPGLPQPRAPAEGEKGAPGQSGRPGPQPAPRVQATPRFPPACPRMNRTCRGPHRSRARPEARSPALYRAAAKPPRPRPHRPGVRVVRRSPAAGSLPGAPSSAPDFLAAEARPFSAMPRASRRLPKEADSRAARRAGGRRAEPEARSPPGRLP